MGQQNQPHRSKGSGSPTHTKTHTQGSLGGRNAHSASNNPLVSIVCCSALEVTLTLTLTLP